MLTVKWIKQDIGYEEIFSANRVWLRWKMHENDAPSKLMVEKVDQGEVLEFTEGQFYIMNFEGKTVGNYFLEKIPQ